jgi:hypothetical protein
MANVKAGNRNQQSGKRNPKGRRKRPKKAKGKITVRNQTKKRKML